jgi:hypothetical protein
MEQLGFAQIDPEDDDYDILDSSSADRFLAESDLRDLPGNPRDGKCDNERPCFRLAPLECFRALG